MMSSSRLHSPIVWAPDKLAVIHDAAAALLSDSLHQDEGPPRATLYWLQDGPFRALRNGIDVLRGQLETEQEFDRTIEATNNSGTDRPNWLGEREMVARGLTRTVYACIGADARSDGPLAMERIRAAEPHSTIALEHFDEQLESPTEREIFTNCITFAREKNCHTLIYARSSERPEKLTSRLGLDKYFQDNQIRIRVYPGSTLLINPANDEIFKALLVKNIGEIQGLHFSIQKEDLVEALVALFHRTANEVNLGHTSAPDENDAADFIIDPETNLRLPPLPRIPYSGRTAKYGQRTSVEDFIKSEWPDYAYHKLLYADALREIDYSLYKALDYRARDAGQSLAEFALRLGILSREHVVAGDSRFPRQVELLRKMRTIMRARRARKRAAALLPEKTP